MTTRKKEAERMFEVIPSSIERSYLSEPPVRFTGCKCKLCGEGIAVNEEIVELENGIYHYDCLDVDAILDILDVPVKEAEISA